MSDKRTSRRFRPSEGVTRGRADLEALRTMTDEEILRTSPPELRDLPQDFFEGARVVHPEPKQAISIRVDADVLEWFKRQGAKYQSRMNAVLRAHMAQTGKKKRRKRGAA